MIPNKERNRERMKQSKFIQKPQPTGWLQYAFGSPESIGLHQNWRKNSKKSKR